MFYRSNRFGKFGDYGYIGQADWFYGGKPAAEFNPCKPGQIKEEWGGGIRCIDPAMMPKKPAPAPAPTSEKSAPVDPNAQALPPQPAGPPPLIDPMLMDDGPWDLEELLPYMIGGGIVIVLLWVLILKL